MIIKVLALAMLCARPAMAYEFQCVHEKNTAPPLDAVAHGWFQQARELSRQRLPDWAQVARQYPQAGNIQIAGWQWPWAQPGGADES